jgi:hypothetical protein
MNGELLSPRSVEAEDSAWSAEGEDGKKYDIKLSSWMPLVGEETKGPLRPFFDPDQQKFAVLKDLRIH